MVVGLVRHAGSPQLAAPRGAEKADLIGRAVDHAGEVLRARAQAQPELTGAGLSHYVLGRSKSIVDKWRGIVSPTVEIQGSAKAYCYSPYEERAAKASALMRTPEADAALDHWDKFEPTDPRFPFVAPTLMRDVEPSTAIWVRRRPKKEDT